MYYLSDECFLKWLETPCIYNIKKDELYELDNNAFDFLKKCASRDGCSKPADIKFLDYCLSEGILISKPFNLKMPPVIKSPIPSLRYLELQITDKCNLKCKHCYIGKPDNNELSIYEIKAVMDEFEEMQGLRLLITGGEPLMHAGFRKLNAILPEYGFRKILFTNGLLLNKELLKELNIDEIQFSIDGMERGHDAIRGKGTYEIVMNKIKDVVEQGFAVSVATMVHKKNLDEFDEMDSLFRAMGIKDWTVDVPCISGNLKENPTIQVTEETAGRYLNYGFGEGLHGGGEGFACGLHLMSVLANGNVCKCAFYSHAPVGNISESLRKCWQTKMPLKVEELECFRLSCEFINACRGGCRFRAGDAYKKDLYKCYSYGIIKASGHEALGQP